MSNLTVIARNPGHYADHHRRPGESFALRVRQDFAANWMEAVGWNPKAPAEPPPVEPPTEPAPAPAPAEPKPSKAKAEKPVTPET